MNAPAPTGLASQEAASWQGRLRSALRAGPWWGAMVALALAIPARGGTMPPLKTVFLILMENYQWSAIKGATNAPYLNQTLLPQASYCEQYYNPSNFTCSLISYLWLEAGTNFGLTTDNPNCDSPPSVNHQATTNHLVTLLNNAGISWKAYQEGIAGTVVPLTDYADYRVRHNPFVYFDDVTGTNDPACAYGLAHIRPYSELAADLANNRVARYNFITPNICDDMHDACSPLLDNRLQGDLWLSNQIPLLMASSAFTNQGAIFITWDDGSFPGVPIGMIVLSPLARGAGYASTNRYTHSDTVRTMQEIFGVTPLLNAAANATNLSELFQPAPKAPTGLRVSSIARNASGAIELTVGGAAPDLPAVLESSVDLATWIPVMTNSSPQTAFTLLVTNLPNPSGQCYYRVSQAAPP